MNVAPSYCRKKSRQQFDWKHFFRKSAYRILDIKTSPSLCDKKHRSPFLHKTLKSIIRAPKSNKRVLNEVFAKLRLWLADQLQFHKLTSPCWREMPKEIICVSKARPVLVNYSCSEYSSIFLFKSFLLKDGSLDAFVTLRLLQLRS